jgi:hypothetical protein
MSSLGEMLPLEYVGPLAGGDFALAGVRCNSGSHTGGGLCKPTGSYTAYGGCNNGNYTTAS